MISNNGTLPHAFKSLSKMRIDLQVSQVRLGNYTGASNLEGLFSDDIKFKVTGEAFG